MATKKESTQITELPGADYFDSDSKDSVPQAASVLSESEPAPWEVSAESEEGWGKLNQADKAQSAVPKVAQLWGPQLPAPSQEQLQRKPVFFQVVADRDVVVKGLRVPMKAGRVLSPNHYDLAGLRRQGLQLRPFRG